LGKRLIVVGQKISTMNIIRLTTALDFGGVEKRIEISAVEFAKRQGVNLYVVAIGNGGAISNSLTKSGIKTILLGESYKIPSIKTIVRLYRLFKTIKPDVVHTSGAEANFHGLIAAYLAGIKVRIGEEIGFPNHNRKWQGIFKITYQFAHKVIGISESVVRKIIELGEVKPNKTVVVYNPVAIKENFSESSANERKEFVFITVSRLVEIKNLDTLIKGFKKVSISSFVPLKLHIVGDGPELENLKRLTKELDLVGQVSFLGFQEDVSNFLSEADAYVLPSFSEGFSIALVEAMIAKLVCIATNVGGPAEIISDRVTGLLIDPLNIEDIIEKMSMAIAFSKTVKDEMGTKARLDVLMRFTPEKYVDNLLTLYKVCLK
jgi:glycosyltransferase involved in cell wall biosynthesis